MLSRYVLWVVLWTAVLAAGVVVRPARAQAVGDGLGTAADAAPLTLTLEDAVQVALANNYDLTRALLDVRNAEAQVREAWGQVLPQVSASGGYTRNLETANPFAGSEAGGIFGSLGAVEWLNYNEQARFDDDPMTQPISFDEFQRRQREGLQEIGASFGGGGNPFGVDNEFQAGITITQTIFNGSAFAAISGAQELKDVNERGADRQMQLLADRVRQAYYDALLAQQQMRVIEQRVQRTEATLREVSRRVVQGVAPKFERLSAEVELANLETELTQVRNTAAQALDNLKLTMGLDVDRPIELADSLEAEDMGLYRTVSQERAVTAALERRPDVEQARLAIELREVEKNTVRSEYLPRLSAVANFNYTGRVPDDRSSVVSDPDDPFSFSRQQRGFFSSDYWSPAVNVGLQLSWNIFSGFQTAARIEQREVAVRRAEVDYEELQQAVELEVLTALRNLEAARQRIESQQQNVARAQTNYEYARRRLSEGVSSQLELREASDQLDQSRLNYLQAVRDYLVARSAFETAIGMPIPVSPANADFKFTRR